MTSKQTTDQPGIFIGLRARYTLIFGGAFLGVLAAVAGWLGFAGVPAILDTVHRAFELAVTTSNIALDPATVGSLRDLFYRGIEFQVWQNVSRIGLGIAAIYVVASMALISAAVSFAHRNIAAVTAAAREIAQGHYEVDLSRLYAGRFRSEISELAHAIEESGRAQLREQQLKREVSQLRIEIDGLRRAQDVHAIIGGDSFKELRKRADEMRRDMAESDPDTLPYSDE
jgi:hypothetical protein